MVGLVFAGLACAFIGGSQLNIWLSTWCSSQKIFQVALIGQTIIIAVILTGTWFGWYGLPSNIVLLLLYLPFCGIAYPNAAALALAPFNRNIGSASALLGFVQMVIGAFASTGVGLLHATTNLPIYAVMAASALIGLVILLANQKRLADSTSPQDGATAVTH